MSKSTSDFWDMLGSKMFSRSTVKIATGSETLLFWPVDNGFLAIETTHIYITVELKGI